MDERLRKSAPNPVGINPMRVTCTHKRFHCAASDYIVRTYNSHVSGSH